MHFLWVEDSCKSLSESILNQRIFKFANLFIESAASEGRKGRWHYKRKKKVVSGSMEKSKPGRMLLFIYWTLTTQRFKRKMGCIAVWLFSSAEQFAFLLLMHSRRASTSRKFEKKNRPLHTSALHRVSFDVLIRLCFPVANRRAAMRRSSWILLKDLASLSSARKHSGSFFIIMSAHL